MEMEYRRLGGAGLRLSALSLGSWVTFSFQVDRAAARELMTLAYDHGVNFFDNAEVYADGDSETIMGQALADLGWARDSFCVSSKVYWGGKLPTQRGLHKKHIREACDAALKRLRVDYLDLFFCHRPDIDTPVEETVRAMHDLVAQGKVLYWGTSEWSARRIQEAWGIAREHGLTPPSMEQPQYNMLHRERVEREYAALYSGIGLGTTIWSPLASGILTGKYAKGIPKGSRMSLPDYDWLRKDLIESERGRQWQSKAGEIVALAAELDMPPAQLAIAWCLKNRNVSSVILGASKPDQLRECLGAMERMPALDDDVMQRIEKVLQNKPEPPQRW
jgi:voltage-dependent potassium channel beta subunit